MVHGIPNMAISPNILTMSQGAKLSLPVDAAALLYSNFEHVAGIAAPIGSEGVSISKLNLLDALISRLNQLQRAQISQSPVNQFEGLDSVIENFNDQIRQAKAASEAMPYIQFPDAQSGELLNLLS